MDLTLCCFIITAALPSLPAMCPTAGIFWESARIRCLSSTVLAGDPPCGRGATPGSRHRLPGASRMHTCLHRPQDASCGLDCLRNFMDAVDCAGMLLMCAC